MKGKAMKHLQVKGKDLRALGIDKNPFYREQKTLTRTEKMDKEDFTQMKNYSSKGLTGRVKR